MTLRHKSRAPFVAALLALRTFAFVGALLAAPVATHRVALRLLRSTLLTLLTRRFASRRATQGSPLQPCRALLRRPHNPIAIVRRIAQPRLALRRPYDPSRLCRRVATTPVS